MRKIRKHEKSVMKQKRPRPRIAAEIAECRMDRAKGPRVSYSRFETQQVGAIKAHSIRSVICASQDQATSQFESTAVSLARLDLSSMLFASLAFASPWRWGLLHLVLAQRSSDPPWSGCECKLESRSEPRMASRPSTLVPVKVVMAC